uniref:OSJNBa0073E02.15 protein n=1 Tax=Oryza sativa subsp. japonica TaxID=39947 RepID=Q7X7P6_ORYSJ|nr:OSJNBa0073E02.15 [Oryza sativa Japonica Group]CAE05620.1 OSJNBb0061C13.2 [Oryza sativa Japonica Group]
MPPPPCCRRSAASLPELCRSSAGLLLGAAAGAGLGPSSTSLPRPTSRLPDHHLLQHHIVALDFCLIAVTETFINPRWPWYHDAAVIADTIPVMSCLMLNHEGFSKSWKLSNSTRQSSCRNGEKYGEAAVKLLAATLRDQWALADKRMHINNNWWRQKRRLVKSASCNYVTGNLFAKHSIYCSAIASQK